MSEQIKKTVDAFIGQIKPIKDITYFFFLFLIFELVWKICVHIGPDGTELIVLGYDLTTWVHPLCVLDANIVYQIIHNILGYENYHINGTLIYFVTPDKMNLKMNIIWTCTSFKQVLLFTFIMGFYFGPWKKKLVFIPLSLLFLSIINILRLVLSAFLIKDGYPDWFIPLNEVVNGVKWDGTASSYRQFYSDWYHLFHDGFFRWVYYDGIMFLIWLLWEEKFNLPYQRHKKGI